MRILAALCIAAAAHAASASSVRVAVQDSSGKPLANAVVFLESPEARQAVKPAQAVEVVQQARQFAPAVSVVPRGTLVQFPNRDTVRHHVYSFSAAKKFELKLYGGTSASPVLFDVPGVVVLGCNIHDDMVAWLLVVDTPYYGLTSQDGTLVLDKVPAGNYRLRAWHSSLPVGAPVHEQAQTLLELGSGAVVTVRMGDAKP